MIYRAGETIIFVAFYTSGGEAKPGLADVIAEVHQIGVGVVDVPPVSEDPDGNGFYYCTYTPPSDGAYVCIFKTSDASVDQKHIAGIAFRGIGGVNNLDAAVSSRLASEDYQSPPTPEQIDEVLTSSHGAGSWQAVSIEPLVLRLAPDELEAVLDSHFRRAIAVFRGDSLDVDISVVDSAGAPVDLTSATAKFTVRRREDDDTALLEKSLEICDPAAGKMRLSLSPTDTDLEPASYPADIQITFSDGRVKTVWKSESVVRWDVGR